MRLPQTWVRCGVGAEYALGRLGSIVTSSKASTQADDIQYDQRFRASFTSPDVLTVATHIRMEVNAR